MRFCLNYVENSSYSFLDIKLVFCFHRNLVLLDCDGDPVWDAINVHYKYITQQLSLCKEKHMAAESNSEDSGSSNFNFSCLFLRVVLVQFKKS